MSVERFDNNVKKYDFNRSESANVSKDEPKDKTQDFNPFFDLVENLKEGVGKIGSKLEDVFDEFLEFGAVLDVINGDKESESSTDSISEFNVTEPPVETPTETVTETEIVPELPTETVTETEIAPELPTETVTETEIAPELPIAP